MTDIGPIAKTIALTATLSGTPNPETGMYEPIVQDFDQLAAFIQQGIDATPMFAVVEGGCVIADYSSSDLVVFDLDEFKGGLDVEEARERMAQAKELGAVVVAEKYEDYIYDCEHEGHWLLDNDPTDDDEEGTDTGQS
jgi:hypothetical protein